MIVIEEHPGYYGAFTRARAKGAWPNGSRVVKVFSEEDDTHELGARAVILGSMRMPDGEEDLGILYFVEWDSDPGVAVACVAAKLKLV